MFDLEPGHHPEEPRLRRLVEPTLRHTIFREISESGRILGAVAALIGPDIRFQASKLNMKSPGFGSPVERHQDTAFYPHTNDDLLACGVALDDADLDNGCLLVVRGPIWGRRSTTTGCRLRWRCRRG